MLFLSFNAAMSAFAKDPPDWFTPLRDAVYMGEGDAAYIARFGREVEDRARRELSEPELSVMLAFCEFLTGKAYQSENINDQAALHFQRGFDYAGGSVKIKPTSEGYRMMAENISQLCTIKSTAWVIANGMKVAAYASKGLEYDSRNGACNYLIAARWVYAPAPFNNIKKGIKEMKEIISGKYDLQTDDYFNVYYALAYAYRRNKQPDEADIWIEKAAAIYPANRDLLKFRKGAERVAASGGPHLPINEFPAGY
jgi:tetratricopeptide (TPR) repeat protein